MNYLDHITEYLTNAQRRISSKATFIIILLLTLLLLDNYFDFSYHYRMTKKIEEIQKISTVINDTLNDSITRQYAISLREQLIDRKTFFDHVSLFFQSENLASSKNEPTTAIKNELLFRISSSGLSFLAAVITLFLSLKDKAGSFRSRITTGIISFTSFFIFGMLSFLIAGKIPLLINTTWLLNYFVNFILQFFLTIIAFNFFLILAAIFSKSSS
jgi:hypothetical protein